MSRKRDDRAVPGERTAGKERTGEQGERTAADWPDRLLGWGGCMRENPEAQRTRCTAGCWRHGGAVSFPLRKVLG